MFFLDETLIESGIKLCVWQVGFLGHLTLWAVSQSGRKLYGEQMEFLRHWAGNIIRYDASGRLYEAFSPSGWQVESHNSHTMVVI